MPQARSVRGITGTDSRLPLYQRLRDEFLLQIAEGHWVPGTPIPTEAEMTREYEVAIGTVRKAIETLVQDGILERQQGRGTFVRRPEFTHSLSRFFRQVDSQGITRIPESDILSLESAPASQHVRQALNLGARAGVIHLERLRRLEGKPLFHERIWLPQKRFAALLETPKDALGDLLYPTYETLCGQLVAHARETLSIGVADASTSELLGVALETPVVVIDRIASGFDGTPLELRRSYGIASEFRYQIEIA
ncbi:MULTISPECIES: GntR family transcriptional regulator [unclassified Cobetia]|uniref:GntR family transcriptional regulator n=1 Tax=unclassified Cobetia TaxID=2609414 RepID=UPI00178CABA4|nr:MULTISPECIES: GntR family transcriptional regulator [unclassified Cobetia]MBE2169890.1 GntR family transcriptional regulator [Cobetia sp. 2AS1]MDH2446892.1 GntR family transcriptional regulator [Cobetia sp. 2AS]